LEAKPRTLRTVFRPDVRLTVPLFQRAYVWTAAEQWQPLWEDVLATNSRVEGGDTIPHFLGAIVLEQKRGALGSLEIREVIDGQQRLTTLQLLIAALRDAFAAHGVDNRPFKRLVKLLVNDEEMVDSADEMHKLWPANRDRAPYRAVMAGDYREVPSSQSLPRIAAAYTFFRDELDDLLEGHPEDKVAQTLDRLAEVIFEYLEVVVIDLDEDDNAQVIFETLNARGTPLRASDLIKNLLFRTLQSAGRDVESRYRSTWEPLEAEHWQVEVRLGRLTRPRLDTFMGFFLVVLLQREVQAHQLFTASRTYLGANADRAEEFLGEVARYAAVYDDLEARRSTDASEAASLARLEIADTQTLTPLLLWLFANTHGTTRRNSLLTLESYVVRRTLCRLTPKNYNRIFLEILRRLGSGEGPVDEVIEKYLNGQGSDSGMWPSDDEVRAALRSLPLFRLLKRDRLQRVLLALDAYFTTSKTEPISASRKMSIEHLMPQSWVENWPLPTDVDAEDAKNERDRLVDTIGNLTLVTGSLNSTMSNGAWAAKRQHLLTHSALTLNRSLPTSWDAYAILQRGADLAEAVIRLWPRPPMPDGAPAFAAQSERDLRPDRDAELLPRSTPKANGRRDIGQHILHVFADLPSGTFRTISQIRNEPSPEYPDSPPSAGAISARLFPSNGGETTVPGVVGTTREGLRGALKR
jgi:hypothetical protein